MKSWIIKNKLLIAGVMLGALAGYGYYYFVGCQSGTCMISSKPLNSTLYFAFMGGLVSGIFKKKQHGDGKA